MAQDSNRDQSMHPSDDGGFCAAAPTVSSSPSPPSVGPSGRVVAGQVPGLSAVTSKTLDSSFSTALSESCNGQLELLLLDRPGTAPAGTLQQRLQSAQAAHVAHAASTSSLIEQRPQSVPPLACALSESPTTAGGGGRPSYRKRSKEGGTPITRVPACSDAIGVGPVRTVRDRKIRASRSQATALLRLQGQQKRNEERARNPFVEYEDKEQRMQQERRWLEADSAYLRERTDHLRQSEVQRSLAEGAAGARTLARNATRDLNDELICRGPYSLHLRALRKEGPSNDAKRPCSAPLPLAGPPSQVGPPPLRSARSARSTGPLRSMKAMQRDLERSSRKLASVALP